MGRDCSEDLVMRRNPLGKNMLKDLIFFSSLDSNSTRKDNNMLASFGFNRLLYGSTGAGTPATSSETQSEISSADSDWSDIRAIANKLGVQNPDDLHTERFKVDRQKLEQMIKSEFSLFYFFFFKKIFTCYVTCQPF